MAVAYRSSGTIVANGDAGLDMSSSLPSGLAIDDIMIFVGMDADNEHFDLAMPDGWTQRSSDNSSTNLGYTIAWKRYDGTEKDWQFDTPSSAGQLVCGVIHAYSGVIKKGVPFASNFTTAVSQRTTHTDSVSGVTGGRMKVYFWIIEDDVVFTQTSDGDWTVNDNQTTTVGSDARLMAYSSFSTSSTTVGGTTGSNEYSAGYGVFLISDADRPTIVPNTADANDFGADNTPTLEFTGSDANDNDLEYQLQIFSAKDVVCDSYSESNQSGTPLPIITDYRGQSFTGNGGVLSKARLYLDKTNNPTGTVRAKIYAHSGTYGTSSVGTGDALEVSDTVAVSTITGTLTLYDFNFSGDLVLGDGTYYVLMLEGGGSFAGGNTVRWGCDDSSPTHGGNSCRYETDTDTWIADSTRDMCFYVETHTRVLDKNSEIEDDTFSNTTDGADVHPFDQPDKIDYTVSNKVEHDSSNQGTYWNLDATTSKLGVSFIAQNNDDLGSIRAYLKKTGSPTGNATAVIYAHTGTFGDDGLPTGSALATSNTFDVSTLTTSYAMTTFTFGTPYTLAQGTEYYLSIEYSGGSGGNTVEWGGDGISNDYPYYGSSAWYDGTWQTLNLNFCYDFTLTKGLEDGTWYWRARAKDPLGTSQWSDWTTIRSFDVGGGGLALSGTSNSST
jgi:hypothetical protein